MENFPEYLDDLWTLFMETIENQELFHVSLTLNGLSEWTNDFNVAFFSFKVQRMKFSSERYGKLTVFIENFEVERIRSAYNILLLNMECILSDEPSCYHGDP